jgi:hypothetical protein
VKGKKRGQYAEPEDEFQKQVLELARRCGWRVAHFKKVLVQRPNGSTYWVTPAAADGKGWPDLALVHPGRGLFLLRELKTDSGKLTPEQRLWLEDLARVPGLDVGVWQPGQWKEIERTLKGEQ